MTAPPHLDTVVHLQRAANGDLVWTTDSRYGDPVVTYRLCDGNIELVDTDIDPADIADAVAKLTDPTGGYVTYQITEQRLVRVLAERFDTVAV